jgi:hypothetical protein
MAGVEDCESTFCRGFLVILTCCRVLEELGLLGELMIDVDGAVCGCGSGKT